MKQGRKSPELSSKDPLFKGLNCGIEQGGKSPLIFTKDPSSKFFFNFFVTDLCNSRNGNTLHQTLPMDSSLFTV